MPKKIAVVMFASLLVLSAPSALGQVGDDDDDVIAVPGVPDATASALLAGCAAAGIAGFRFFLKKTNR
jgi:hypothetical protein